MDKIIKYEHYGTVVSVKERLKGTHRENCLCYSCEFFHPGEESNCYIAQELFGICVKYHITTPVFECPKFKVK